MATTVEAHPPGIPEDFPSPTDEGLSSPESEDYPHKPHNQDYLYNDSGINLDESSVNNVTQGEDANGQDLDDNLSDTSETDPSFYHISRQDNSYHDDEIRCNINTQVQDENQQQNDSAIHMNGETAIKESSSHEEIAEETIEVSQRERLPNAFDQFPELTEPVMTQDTQPSTPSPVTIDTDGQVAMETEHVKPPEAPTEEEGEEVVEDLIARSEVKEEEEVVEDNRVDFIPGLACRDVETALQILKTHYRLSTSSLKKCIITSPDNKTKRYSAPVFSYDRSRWNLTDMIRAPNEDMPWWSKTREPEPVVTEQDDFQVLTDTIERKQDEITQLLQKIIDDDDRKKKDTNAPLGAQPEEDIIERQEEPTQNAAPEGPATDEPAKKKKGNLFQRMIRAVRKRLSRNRHRA